MVYCRIAFQNIVIYLLCRSLKCFFCLLHRMERIRNFCNDSVLYKFLGRPYVVTGGLIKCSWCVFFLSFFIRHAFSEIPRPIALKLCHMVGIWPNFIMQVQKLGGTPPKKIRGPKTCKISVDFGSLQTLIAHISGTAEDIQNRPALQTMAIPPAFN